MRTTGRQRLPHLAGFAVALAIVLAPASHAYAQTGNASPKVLAAGDVAFCDRSLRRKIKDLIMGNSGEIGATRTGKLLDSLPGTILVLGDLAYWDGTAEEFSECYDPAWGRHKDRSYPAPGNHEYRSPEAAPYYAYFGERAAEPDKGYYSFDLGAWHLIALNSNIDATSGSAQEAWLRGDLAATTARCILAYWHHPVFSSGKNRDIMEMRDAYAALYEAGASLVLAGHDHNYERFEPMDPKGRLDRERGIRSFVVGTGGGQLKAYAISDPPRENSALVDGSAWGVLELTLHEASYDWRFVPVEGHSLDDRGSADCVERRSPG